MWPEHKHDVRSDIQIAVDERRRVERQVMMLEEQVKELKEEVADTREALIACTVCMDEPKLFKRSAVRDIRENARAVIDRE